MSFSLYIKNESSNWAIFFVNFRFSDGVYQKESTQCFCCYWDNEINKAVLIDEVYLLNIIYVKKEKADVTVTPFVIYLRQL